MEEEAALRRNCEEILKAVPCTVRSGNAVEDETKVTWSGPTCMIVMTFEFISTGYSEDTRSENIISFDTLTANRDYEK